MNAASVWIAGEWRDAASTSSFGAMNPSTGTKLVGEYPVSTWSDCNDALNASVEAARALRSASGEEIARFLEGYAHAIEGSAGQIVAMAHAETGLAIKP